MERVKDGEMYWYVNDLGEVVRGLNLYDFGSLANCRTELGNRFHTKEEAEAMARKLRAVLKGADVIEMPSEEEIKQYADTAIYNPKDGDRRVHTCEVISYASGIENGIEWLKSKCIR